MSVGEGGVGFGDVVEGVVYFRFEELDFDEDKFVVYVFEFFEEVVDKCKSIIVCLFFYV